MKTIEVSSMDVCLELVSMGIAIVGIKVFPNA